MNTEKLKEEIVLLEKRVELLEVRLSELKRTAEGYPQSYHSDSNPWWLETLSDGTVPILRASISTYSGIAITERKEDQFSYTN